MVCAGHLHRDPNSDVAEPDPKLPAPTCLVNITWIVARAEPDRSETRATAKARRFTLNPNLMLDELLDLVSCRHCVEHARAS